MSDLALFAQRTTGWATSVWAASEKGNFKNERMSVSDPEKKIEWGADSEPRKNERVPSSVYPNIIMQLWKESHYLTFLIFGVILLVLINLTHRNIFLSSYLLSATAPSQNPLSTSMVDDSYINMEKKLMYRYFYIYLFILMQNCPPPPPPLQVSVMSCVWEESLGYTKTGPVTWI